MSMITYEQFIQSIEKNKILPFSGFIPDYPSLTELAAHNDWHTDSDTDPWQWRVKVVYDGIAAYGKFFNDKVCFIHKDLFPVIRTILSSNKTALERYKDGLLSRTAYHLYHVLSEYSNMDSRNLRKIAGLHNKEDKKEYEKALVELQNFGDIVITGAVKQNSNEKGWSSMCYQPADMWMATHDLASSYITVEDAKQELEVELLQYCSEKSTKFFDKKLR